MGFSDWEDPPTLQAHEAKDILIKAGLKLNISVGSLTVYNRKEGTEHNFGGLTYGEDTVVLIMAGENVKTAHIRYFIENHLKCYIKHVPRDTGKKIYGLIGYITASHQAIKFAHQNGMYVIRSHNYSDRELIAPPKGFKPRNFHP